MNRNTTHRILFLVLAGFGSLVTPPIATAELVQIQLNDGRTVFGTLTGMDEKNGWIEISSTSADVELKSRFPTSNVISIRPISIKQNQIHQDSGNNRIPVPRISPVRRDDLAGLRAPLRHRSQPEKRKVKSVQMIANAANWDRDLADDGLLVFIRLLDRNFSPIEQGGTIRLQLYGERFEANLDEKRFLSLGQWGMKIKPDDFHNGQLILKLPWRTIDPSLTGDFIPEGLLTARVNVPGEGSFDVTDPNVPLRPATILRDELQMRRGTRFFPAENVPQR